MLFCDATLNIEPDGIVTVVVFLPFRGKTLTNRRSTPGNHAAISRTLWSPAQLVSDQDLAIHPFRTSASARGRLFLPLISTTIGPSDNSQRINAFSRIIFRITPICFRGVKF